jgi:hypothetical protein
LEPKAAKNAAAADKVAKAKEAAAKRAAEAAERKAAAAAQAVAKAEERRKAAEQNKAAAEAKRAAARERTDAQNAARATAQQRIAEKKKQQAAAAAKAKKVEKVVKEARPRSTISLFGLGLKDDDDDVGPPRTAPKPSSAVKLMAKAPRGVPTIEAWKQKRDGSISGKIYGSPNFTDGEIVSTSPILSDAVTGSVVQTSSGSR